MKLHIYRMAFALASIASAVEVMGAGRKIC